MQPTKQNGSEQISFLKWCNTNSGSNTGGILIGLAIGSPMLIGVCALAFGPIALGIITFIGVLLAVMFVVGLTIVIIGCKESSDERKKHPFGRFAIIPEGLIEQVRQVTNVSQIFKGAKTIV